VVTRYIISALLSSSLAQLSGSQANIKLSLPNILLDNHVSGGFDRETQCISIKTARQIEEAKNEGKSRRDKSKVISDSRCCGVGIKVDFIPIHDNQLLSSATRIKSSSLSVVRTVKRSFLVLAKAS